MSEPLPIPMNSFMGQVIYLIEMINFEVRKMSEPLMEMNRMMKIINFEMRGREQNKKLNENTLETDGLTRRFGNLFTEETNKVKNQVSNSGY